MPALRAVGLVCSLAACGSEPLAPPEPSPPGPGSIQPSIAATCATPGSGWIFCDDFEADRLSRYFEYNSAGGAFVRLAGAGRNGSVGMRAHFNAGQVSAGSLHLAFGKTPQAYMRPVDAGIANYRELWWRVYVRYMVGWTGGGGMKMSRMLSFASSTSWAEAMVGHVWSGGTGNYQLVLDPASGTDAAGNLKTTTYNDGANFRWLGMAKSLSQLFLDQDAGRWLCVETHIRLNTPGYSDGLFELVVDGKSEARRTGLNWIGSFTKYGLNAMFLENYWNTGSPKGQVRYFDDLVVSTKPIGC